MVEDVESENSNVSNFDEPVLLKTLFLDKAECFDPGGDNDKIHAFLAIEFSTNIEEGYYDSEGDVFYLESFLSNDTTHNLSSEVKRGGCSKVATVRYQESYFDPLYHGRDEVLEYPESNKEINVDEYYRLPPLHPCFQTPQPCTIFNFISRYSSEEVDIDSVTLEEYELYKVAMSKRKRSQLEEILDDLFRIRVENLKRMEQEEVHNGCNDEKSGDIDQEDGDLLNLPIFPIINVFANVCKQVKDNINVNTTKEKEEVHVEDVEMDEDRYYSSKKTKGIQGSPLSILKSLKILGINLSRCVPWKPSRDFTRPLRIPRGFKFLLHTLNATVIPTKLYRLMQYGVVRSYKKHFESGLAECHTKGDDELLVVVDLAR
ncbi:hypothetical protein Tco_1246559 [Tanacetum coccineum]